MKKRCSIEQGEEKKLLIRAKSWKIDRSVFFGATRYIMRKVLICIVRWCPYFTKMSKWRLTRFAIKLLICYKVGHSSLDIDGSNEVYIPFPLFISNLCSQPAIILSRYISYIYNMLILLLMLWQFYFQSYLYSIVLINFELRTQTQW